MGGVVLGAIFGTAAAIAALSMGAGVLSAFAIYSFTGFLTLVGTTLMVLVREGSGAFEAPEPMPITDTMTQWMEDPETRLLDDDDDDQSKVA